MDLGYMSGQFKLYHWHLSTFRTNRNPPVFFESPSKTVTNKVTKYISVTSAARYVWLAQALVRLHSNGPGTLSPISFDPPILRAALITRERLRNGHAQRVLKAPCVKVPEIPEILEFLFVYFAVIQVSCISHTNKQGFSRQS